MPLAKPLPAAAALFGLFLVLSGCRNGSEPASTSSCSLVGTWSACIPDGSGNSQKITIAATADSLVESFDDYAGVADCSGVGVPGMQFTATYRLGAPGASSRIQGATDAVLRPSVDFGCGLGVDVYTSMLFASDCQSFQPGDGTPGCTPETSPVTVGSLTFSK